MKDQNPSREPVGDAGRVSELLAALRQIEENLVNLQPKIPQACYPGHTGFIDNYVNPCIQIARAALEASKTPEERPRDSEPSFKIKGRIPWPTDKKESFHGLRKPRKNWRPPGQAK